MSIALHFVLRGGAREEGERRSSVAEISRRKGHS